MFPVLVQFLAMFIINEHAPFLNVDWASTADTLSKSVVYIQTPEGSCTGMVINANWKGGKDLVLTDKHCEASEIYADGAVAKPIYKRDDLMVLEVDDLDRPAVVFAKADPKQGDEVGSFGFGMGLSKPMLRIAHVSNPSIDIPDVPGGPFVMIDAAYVAGQSGGAVVNASGEVVSIVQRASGTVGIGVGAENITKAVKRYLEKPAKP